jgi:hypothetical protein
MSTVGCEEAGSTFPLPLGLYPCIGYAGISSSSKVGGVGDDRYLGVLIACGKMGDQVAGEPLR